MKAYLLAPLLVLASASAAPMASATVVCGGSIVAVSVTPATVTAEFPWVHVEAVFQPSNTACRADAHEIAVDGRYPSNGPSMRIENNQYIVSGDFLLAPGPHVARAWMKEYYTNDEAEITWTFTSVVDPEPVMVGGASQPIETPEGTTVPQVTTVGPVSVPYTCAPPVICVGPGPEVVPATPVPQETPLPFPVWADLVVTADPVSADAILHAVTIPPQTHNVPTIFGPVPITICPSSCIVYGIDAEGSTGIRITGTITVAGTTYPVDVPVSVPP